MQSLRSSLNKKYPKVHKLITIATGTSPFNDEKQQPSTSLNKGWSKAVDSFYIMVIECIYIILSICSDIRKLDLWYERQLDVYLWSQRTTWYVQ